MFNTCVRPIRILRMIDLTLGPIVRPSNAFKIILTTWKYGIQQWKIKINNDKSTRITFTLRQDVVPPVSLANKIIPSVTNVKYLGLILDKRLAWTEHIKQKRVLLNPRRKCLYPLLGKHSKLNLNNNNYYFTKPF